MAKATLSHDLEDAGRELLEKLDLLHLDVHTAGWVYFQTVAEWRFYVMTPLVDTMGFKKVYSLLSDALDAMGMPAGVTIFDIHLESPGGDLNVAIMSWTVKGSGTIRFADCRVNGVPFDAVMYRMNTAPPERERYQKRAQSTFLNAVEKVRARASA